MVDVTRLRPSTMYAFTLYAFTMRAGDTPGPMGGYRTARTVTTGNRPA
ncbi:MULTISPECIES: hypothetical protein [Streptomyces]|nr:MULTISPECIES: hypothetical protein [Streptomyces]MCH0557269.1 hypothetical protein [Streptomyces sp. MUM 16J]